MAAALRNGYGETPSWEPARPRLRLRRLLAGRLRLLQRDPAALWSRRARVAAAAFPAIGSTAADMVTNPTERLS